MFSERLQKELERTDHRAIRLRYLAGIKNLTIAESILKEKLTEFTPQVPLLDFIVDFINLETGVCVEVDGLYHWNQFRKDRRRDLRLYNELGICTLRVLNEDVIDNPDLIVEKIRGWNPIPPSMIDERPLDQQKSYQLTREVNNLLKRWRSRKREDVIADYDFLRRFSQEGFEYQIRFLDRIGAKATYWPEDGYPTIKPYWEE